METELWCISAPCLHYYGGSIVSYFLCCVIITHNMQIRAALIHRDTLPWFANSVLICVNTSGLLAIGSTMLLYLALSRAGDLSLV